MTIPTAGRRTGTRSAGRERTAAAATPGIWWFFGCFICLGLACGGWERLLLCLGLSALNLGYAWYQDRLIFVKEFSDYEDYRKTVPFLIPKMRKGGGAADDL